MAVSANSVWEIRSTATAGNVNGGFFVTGASGVDYSQQNAAQYNLTGCTSAAADAIILNANAAADMVGNGAHVISGTNATPGWYEIISVVVGVSITLDRSWGTAAVALGVVNIGGALSLGSSDVAIFNTFSPGNLAYVKGGTNISYTLNGSLSFGTAGTSLAHIKFEGYASTRGDRPLGVTRPTFICAGAAFGLANFIDIRNIIFTGTGTSVVSAASGTKVIGCKMTNSSTSAGRAALLGNNNAFVFGNELISYRGFGFSSNNGGVMLYGNYIHDCDEGIHNFAAGNDSSYIGNLIESCVTAAIRYTNSATELSYINANTLYGSENKTGTGLLMAAGVVNVNFSNNIVYGFTTGVSHGAANSCYDDYNDYFNNTADVSNWTKGANDIATNPTFTSVAQVVVTTATTSNTGNTLVKAGATFQTSGVTAGRDCVYISSTSGTVGIYGIVSVDSETQLTLDLAPGNSAGNVSAQITTGRNFAVGANMKAMGYPGAFGGAYTTGYLDLGAAQRQGGISTDPGIANVKSGIAYVINDTSLVGTLVVTTAAQAPTVIGNKYSLS